MRARPIDVSATDISAVHGRDPEELVADRCTAAAAALARSSAVALGTVSSNLPAAIEEMQAGQASFKVDAVRGWLLLRLIGPGRQALDAVVAGSSRLS